MRIRLKKLEAGVVLTCLPDGHPPAVQRSGHGGFFALHDLMHFAVETTLGLQQAFFDYVNGVVPDRHGWLAPIDVTASARETAGRAH